MLYQASGPIANQVVTRHSYLNKSTITFILSSPSLLGDCSIGIKDYRSLYLFWLRLSFSLFFLFSAWVKASLHCWKSTFSAFSLYLTPAAWKRRAENKHFSNQAQWLKGFCVRGILTTSWNPLNKRDSWVTSRGNSSRWLGQLLAEAQYLPWALRSHLPAQAVPGHTVGVHSMQQHRLEQIGQAQSFFRGELFSVELPTQCFKRKVVKLEWKLSIRVKYETSFPCRALKYLFAHSALLV